MLEIIPGILEKDWDSIEEKLEEIKSFTSIVHIDIIDGKFAPRSTFLDPSPFKRYSEDIFLELHMMVDNPIEFLEPWANVGVKRFLGHIEKMDDQAKFITAAQSFGEAGLAIDGGTSLDAINVDYEKLDALLIMTINAGSSGQEFMEDLLEKVRTIREKTSIPIEVDGGINDKTIAPAKDAGATRFISTSHIFGSDNPKAAFQNLSVIIK